MNVNAQENESLSMINYLSSESKILDKAYLTKVSQDNPRLIERWYIMLSDSWELREHPTAKPISTAYKVLDERIWKSSNVLDMELTHMISRDVEKEVVYRIGETSTFLILKPIRFVNQSVNKSRTLSSLTQKSEAQR